MEDVKMTDVEEVQDVSSTSMMAAMSSPRADISSTSAAPVQSQGGEVDSWIEVLSKCRQLPEEDVKRLCDTVVPFTKLTNGRQEKYYMKNPMFNLYGVPSPYAATFTANFMIFKNYSV
jgi:hypothetical protein